MEKKVSIKSNFFFNAFYQLINIFVPLITTPYLSRVLKAEGLGEYSFAYSVAYYFYVFIRLGLHSYGNRSIAYVKDDRIQLSRTFCSIYAFQLFLGIIVSITYFFYALLYAPERKLAMIFWLVVIAGTIDLTWFLYGLEEFRTTAIRDVVVKLFTTVCLFTFVNDITDVWIYALIYSMGFIISQIVVIPLVIKRVNYIKPTIYEIKSHIKPNIILFLPTIAISIYKVMDKIMLGILASSVELGYYHCCENIILVPLALITALGTTMLPRMSNMLASDTVQTEMDNIFTKSVTFAMFTSSSMCIGIMTVAKEFVPIFYGAGFERCIELFYIILPSCIFLAFANVIRTQYLLPRKYDMIYVVSLFTGAGINLILNLLLIPRLASVGAAIGTLVAEMVVCLIQAGCVYKEARIGICFKNSIPYVISGVIMFIMLHDYVVPFDNDIMALIIKIIISGVVYLIVLGGIILVERLLKMFKVGSAAK